VLPKEIVLALAKGAQNRGAKIFENVEVQNLLQRKGRVTGVVTALARSRRIMW